MSVTTVASVFVPIATVALIAAVTTVALIAAVAAVAIVAAVATVAIVAAVATVAIVAPVVVSRHTLGRVGLSHTKQSPSRHDFFPDAGFAARDSRHAPDARSVRRTVPLVAAASRVHQRANWRPAVGFVPSPDMAGGGWR